MSVHKSNNNTWYVKYKNKTIRGFKTKTDALRHEAKLKLDIINNSKTIRFYALIDDFLQHKKSEVAISSYKKIERIANGIIIPNTINKYMEEIDENDCKKFRDFLTESKYSTLYKNQIILCYKNIFKYAQTYYKLKDNPTYVINSFRKTFEEKMQTKERELNVWSDKEFKLFIQCVTSPIYQHLFTILFYTGLRIGEAQALTWKDFENGSLNITKSLCKVSTENKPYIIKDTKSVNSMRSVTLGEKLNNYLNIFKERESKLAGFNEQWFIFGRNNPLPRTTITRIKNNAIKKANVKQIRLHGFRHSHATNLILSGVNFVLVSKRLGHSDINTTLRTYTHLLKEKEIDIENYIDNCINL